MKVLLTGGAGYIGSHVNKLLDSQGIETVVLDNLRHGHREAVGWGRLIEADLLDYEALNEVFASEHFDAVLHFAAYIFVGESVREPEKYYRNNLNGGLNLLRAMRANRVERLIFSSTAAVYGEPTSPEPIPESHPVAPINPYGWSKLVLERMIEDYCAAYGWRSIIFRYFNAAGADPGGEIGECHDPENHLIPLLLKAVLDEKRKLTVFGTDYDTPDGTCIRDYIHVMDLADAHWLGLKRVMGGGGGENFCEIYNIGNGNGFSVRQVLDSAARVTGSAPGIEYGARRPGDAPVLVAESSLLKKKLGWIPRHPGLDSIIADAWAWERNKRF
ncbi:MAG: UDP-glucose 4-epimerase GalE [Gemmatimonadota bacterium]|nr:UDP-glucose 4-epimerase GalE [Gemmatimonadota bacterium]